MQLGEAIEIVSYKMGLKLGEEAKQDSLLDADVIDKAIEDKQNDSAQKIEAKSYLTATKLLKAERIERYRKENESFLVENAKRDEVIITNSGLQYEILSDADGKKPAAFSEVRVHYEGKRIDGTVFDSTLDGGQPISFPLSKVIKGWQEGLQLMPVGSRYRFHIPFQLGYGDADAGSDLPAYSTLIFEVELLKIL